MSIESLKTLRLEWVEPNSLDDNPANWRRHPELQREALSGALDEVGWAGALLYNETTRRLIDGHARKEIALRKGIPVVPVLIGAWTEANEKKILLTLDPLASLAEADPQQLNQLLRDVQTGSEALATLLTQLAEEARIIPPADDEGGDGEGEGGGDDDESGQLYCVKVSCPNESKRDDLMAMLRAEGYDCQAI